MLFLVSSDILPKKPDCGDFFEMSSVRSHYQLFVGSNQHRNFVPVFFSPPFDTSEQAVYRLLCFFVRIIINLRVREIYLFKRFDCADFTAKYNIASVKSMIEINCDVDSKPTNPL